MSVWNNSVMVIVLKLNMNRIIVPHMIITCIYISLCSIVINWKLSFQPIDKFSLATGQSQRADFKKNGGGGHHLSPGGEATRQPMAPSGDLSFPRSTRIFDLIRFHRFRPDPLLSAVVVDFRGVMRVMAHVLDIGAPGHSAGATGAYRSAAEKVCPDWTRLGPLDTDRTRRDSVWNRGRGKIRFLLPFLKDGEVEGVVAGLTLTAFRLHFSRGQRRSARR